MKSKNNRKFFAIGIPIAGVLTGLMVAATITANVYSGALDTYLGRGAKKISNIDSASGWDTTYYEQKYATSQGESGSQLAAAKVAKSICDEGIVLLKNDGALPLAKNSAVAPFGYRFYNPFYGGSGSGSVVTTDAYVVNPEQALAANFSLTPTFRVDSGTQVRKYYYDTTAGNDVLYFFDYSNSFNGSDQSIYEFDQSVYNTAAIEAGTTGIVFLGRAGGENNDLWTIPYNKVGNIPATAAGTADGAISKVSDATSTSEVKHALDLMPEEKDALALAKSHCDKVVVVINSSNAMQLGALADDKDIDAVVWIGGPGAKGFQSLSDILCGAVNPSGKTPDIYVRDVTQDPTYKNIGDVDGFAYSNTAGLGPMAFKQYSGARKGQNPMEYIEYEEGVYLGYKYYETANDLSLANFTYGALDGKGGTSLAGQVVYPFGYGLSYTSFDKTITSFSGNKDDVKVSVKVTNTGTRAGKDVAEIYWTAPYTALDSSLGVEKPTAVLAGFGKTDSLEPGESQTLTISFGTDEMASYAYRHDNGDGTKGCYLLDAGDYAITLRNDSHRIIDTKSFHLSDTLYYTQNNPRPSEKTAQAKLDENGTATAVPAKADTDTSATFVAATNHFQESSDYMDDATYCQKLTRSTADGLSVSNLVAGAKYKAAPDWVVKELAAYDVNSDALLGNVEGSKAYHAVDPKEAVQNGQTLTNYRGVDYYSPLWDDLLDQISYSSTELLTLMFKDQYCVNPLAEIGLGASKSLDGPQGLTITSTFGSSNLSSCAWSTEPVVAATFNVELAKAYGEALGQEALTIGDTGWYAPGLNTHRTAFSGRNFEYYSEDGVLAGKMAAQVISGASGMGVTCYMKHFALNDNDTNRANICVWANEQAMREIYLKPFEIATKEAMMSLDYIKNANGEHASKTVRAATGVMTSYNYVGATFSSGNYGLLSETLRDEWGFQGVVISDMTGGAASRRDQTLRAGNDMILYFQQINATDVTSSSAKWAMRNAVKHIAYAAVNSNWMQGAAPGAITSYEISPWALGLWIASVVVYGGVLVYAGIGVYRVVKGKKEQNGVTQ